MLIINKQQIKPIETPSGETIWELGGLATDNTSKQSVAYVSIAPLKASVQHFHPEVEETYYIVKAQGLMQIDDEQQQVNSGDFIVIKPTQSHKIINLSDKQDLELIVACVPARFPECAIYTE